MVKVKICGITNIEDAQAAIEAGCDALGFVFYKKSPRYISPARVEQIVKDLPRQVAKVGVFVDERERAIKEIARQCGLNMLQFHGDETKAFCNKFKSYKVIKAFRIKNSLGLKDIVQYNSYAYLFDTFATTKFGGTGKSFDWKLVRRFKSLRQPIFLSGGLTARSVRRALRIANPDWVDVSSAVEISPGKKDHSKIITFIKAAKKTDEKLT